MEGFTSFAMGIFSAVQTTMSRLCCCGAMATPSETPDVSQSHEETPYSLLSSTAPEAHVESGSSEVCEPRESLEQASHPTTTGSAVDVQLEHLQGEVALENSNQYGCAIDIGEEITQPPKLVTDTVETEDKSVNDAVSSATVSVATQETVNSGSSPKPVTDTVETEDKSFNDAVSSATVSVATQETANSGSSPKRVTDAVETKVAEDESVNEAVSSTTVCVATQETGLPANSGLSLAAAAPNDTPHTDLREPSRDERPYRGPTVVSNQSAAVVLIYPPANLEDRLRRYLVAFEYCMHVPTSPNTAFGYVSVLKKAKRRHRNVTVKYSCDRWKTSHVVKSHFSRARTEVKNSNISRYEFHLPFPPGAEVDFSVVYQVKGVKYHDNNCGSNYIIGRP